MTDSKTAAVILHSTATLVEVNSVERALCAVSCLRSAVLRSRLVTPQLEKQQQSAQHTGGGGDTAGARYDGRMVNDGASISGGGTAIATANLQVASSAAAAAARAQPMLQQLLLDAIAIGLVTTGQSVLTLLQ